MRRRIVFLLLAMMFTVVQAWAAIVERPTEEAFRKEMEEARLMSLGIATCSGTYVSKGRVFEYDFLREYGWRIDSYKSNADGVEANFMIATNPAMKMGVLAFRGSSSLGDWKQDFTLDQVNFGGTSIDEFKVIASAKAGGSNTPKVHRGFNNYVTAALNLQGDIDGDRVADDIVQKLKGNSDFKLLVTGHSLGGAAAIIYGARLVSMGVNPEQVPVIVFGAPHVGNAAFAKEYGSKLDLLCVETTMDPVPLSLNLLGSKYSEMGRVRKLHVSRKYTDNFHDPAFYYDYVMKHYYQLVDEGISLGFIEALPDKKLTEGVPLVAILVKDVEKQPNEEFMPDIRRFAIDEYKTLFPSYVVLEDKLLQTQWENSDWSPVIESARKAGADYLLLMSIGRRRVAQGSSWYVYMEQTLLQLPGARLVTMQETGNSVQLSHGVMQACTADVAKCRDGLREHLTFLKTPGTVR